MVDGRLLQQVIFHKPQKAHLHALLRDVCVQNERNVAPYIFLYVNNPAMLKYEISPPRVSECQTDGRTSDATP